MPANLPILDHPFTRAFVPVLVTYALAAIGLTYFDSPSLEIHSDIPVVLGPIIVVVFTASHAVFPVFVYSVFVRALRKSTNVAAKGAECFIYVHMAFWFGIPILGLAALTGWLSLVGAVVHLVMSPRGTRTWVFVEYGSTAVALVLFVLIFTGQKVFPWGILVVLFQSLLLAVVGAKGRNLYVQTTRAVP